MDKRYMKNTCTQMLQYKTNYKLYILFTSQISQVEEDLWTVMVKMLGEIETCKHYWFAGNVI